MLLIFFLVAVILPWQVAFLGCWVIHLVTCATTHITPAVSGEAMTPPRSLSPTRNTSFPPYDYSRLLSRLEFISARWCLLPPGIVALLRGARHTYEVFDWVWVAVSVLVVLRVGPRYWERISSSRVLISRT